MSKRVPPTPSAPAALGPYSVVTEANGFVFVSGQVGIDPASGDAPDDVEGQARQVMNNIRSILADVGLTPDSVVKSVIYLRDIGDFAAVNEIYGGYFEGDPPSRSTVAVAGLPRDLLVEIDVTAVR